MDMPPSAVPHSTARRIQEMIASGELCESELLPPHHELAERLNVSRASLGEAFSVLQTVGLLRTEHRRDTIVARKEVLPHFPCYRCAYRSRIPLDYLTTVENYGLSCTILGANDRSAQSPAKAESCTS